ncbi:NAD(P)/FAD-dependent oxidoreductase [Jiella pelagia]|uniref:FAD-dependent oxidoreductase n=1 Tax=Jiella pelagia TaxID=2986949 RepID=A0ABY7BV60_9HYPH|nr:FAD-dependent oxidoreductase [Jiella pelagia]WAP66786.1 FAD-dependent oxidoreductase [Jiella pelagia]
MAGMVIIGAGECGARAAMALREAGYKGAVTLLDAERHDPYERPPLSKQAMLDKSAAPKGIGGADRLAEAGIDFSRSRRAERIDRAAKSVLCDDGAVLPYERLLIATGARPRPWPGGAGDVAYLRTFDDAARIRAALGPGKRLVVIGGGFIGLELAASARALKADVTVIEAQPRLLSRAVPPEIAAVLEERHAAEGVEVLTDAQVESIGDDKVLLADGTGISADLVVIGIGAVPNVELAAEAGLALDNGIAVDATLATSDATILAAGDCCSFPLELYDGRRVRLESWRGAQELGALAARNMLGAGETAAIVPWFWSDQYDMTLQIAGLAEGAEHHVRRLAKNGALLTFHLAADGRLLAASGIGSGNAVAKDIRLSEMLIARRAAPDPDALADPDVNLKKLL